MPSVSTIERILRQTGLTKPRQAKEAKAVAYPHLHPAVAHELTQVDMAPHYLTGGESIACFNSIDVVSRYPAGQQFKRKSSTEAADFLLHTWHELGLSRYLQMDNESCFSGGYTHPGVIGQVVRLALLVGVQPVFSPFYHPESNGSVERFHQDYSALVWQKLHLDGLAAVRQRSALFFPTTAVAVTILPWPANRPWNFIPPLRDVSCPLISPARTNCLLPLVKFILSGPWTTTARCSS